MKILQSYFVVLAIATALGTQASADELFFVEDIPTNILFGSTSGGEAFENPQGSASSQSAFGFRNADGVGQAGTRTRGQSFTFTTGDNLTHDIGSLSVSLNNPLSNTGFRPDGQLELTVFEWDSNDPSDFTNWDVSTGGVFANNHVELYRQSFPVLGTDPFGEVGVGNQLLVQISFDTGSLQLTDGTSYGFLFRYTLDSLVDDNGDPLTSDISFAFDTRQDSDVVGSLINTNAFTDFAAADNGQSNSPADPDNDRDMNFFFAGPDTSFLLGDVNQDEVVNFLDISPFIAVLSSGGFQLEADIDGNGVVNFLDISPFIGLLSGN